MKNKGITLVALTITIIILLIIAGISINIGGNMIKKANLEGLKTNMMLIQAKAKQYVEEANVKMGKNPDDARKQSVRQEIYEDKAKLSSDTNSITTEFDKSDCYLLTEDSYNEWGLNKIKLEENEYYFVKFNEQELTVEVYNTPGFNGKYSLTDIDKIEE